MHRLTVYLTDELYDAIVRHSEAAGQKLSTFISRELAYLQIEPVKEDGSVIRHARQAAAEGTQWLAANAKREAR